MRHLTAGKVLLAAAAAAVALLAPRAEAQIGGGLPPAVVESPAPTAAQLEEIRDYIAKAVSDLESGEPAGIKRGRMALEEPAASVRATVAFRAAYGEAVLPHLERLARSDNEIIVLNAIQVAGAVATGPALELADRYRSDSRPAVRLKAVYAVRDALRAINTAPTAFSPDGVQGIIDRLASGLASEGDPNVADMYVRALLEGAGMGGKFEALANHSLSALMNTVAGRVRKIGDGAADRAMLPAILRTAEAARDVLAADVIQRRRPQPLVIDAAGFGGDLLAYIFRRVRAGALPVADGPGPEAADRARAQRTTEVALTQVGVNIIFSARDRLAQGMPEGPPDLARMIAEATPTGDKNFQSEVVKLIGPGGLLTRPPFNFNPSRFVGER